MNLSPTEQCRLLIFSAAEFARRNLRERVLLSAPEAIALLTDEAMQMARRGMPYDHIRDTVGHILTENQVQPGVPAMTKKILVELPMAEGTKLLAIFDPIEPIDGVTPEPIPGEVISSTDEVLIFQDSGPTVTLSVMNRGDRDIQVRSQTHFFEVNRALRFDRRAAYGMKLALPAGSGMRFEPGLTKPVTLMPMSGSREIYGFAGLVNGNLDDPQVREATFRAAAERGYLDDNEGDSNDFD